jgi:hypothetical protein
VEGEIDFAILTYFLTRDGEEDPLNGILTIFLEEFLIYAA